MSSPSRLVSAKSGLHPRNRHGARYDFRALIRTSPGLAAYVQRHPVEGDTIDFWDPAAVMTLNRALLKHYYNVAHWDLPRGYLCPPIPGRADYVHHLADVLGAGDVTSIPRGPAVAVLDIGIGANCVYPIVGVREYGWRFVGTDIDPVAVASARRIVAENPALAGQVECRLQASARDIFAGAVRPGETFAAAMCNPPFHASAAEAAAGTLRKFRNLNAGKAGSPVLNFGGRSHELWCSGGEAAFVRRMITQSAERPGLCRWFTTLVSKAGNLPAIQRALDQVRPRAVRFVDMAHGQKRSRIVAWTFQETGAKA